MADGDMTSFIAGSPMAPLQTQAAQGQQLLNASLPANPGTTGWGVLGNMIGELRGQSMLSDAQGGLTQAYQNAMPSLARAYASDNPFQTIANDPNADPYAKWLILNQPPSAVAGAQHAFAGAGLTRAETPEQQARGIAYGRAISGLDPATGRPLIPGGNIPGLPLSSVGSAAAPAGAGESSVVLGHARAVQGMSADQGQAYLNGLPPNVRTQVLQYIRMHGRAAAPAASAGAP